MNKLVVLVTVSGVAVAGVLYRKQIQTKVADLIEAAMTKLEQLDDVQFDVSKKFDSHQEA